MNDSPPIGFLDANVLANAILAENRVTEIRQEALAARKPREQIIKQEQRELKSYRPAQSAYALTQLLRGPHDPELHAITSDLALLEVTQVLVEEYKAKKLWKQHVPFRYWHSSQKEIELTQDDLEDIQIGIFKFSSRTRHVITRENAYELKTAETLVSRYGCDARDSILVATAIQSLCPIFVTEDERLKRKLRKFNKIGVVKTQALVNQLKSMPLPSFYMESRD